MPRVSDAPNLNLSSVGGKIAGDSAPADTEENVKDGGHEPIDEVSFALVHSTVPGQLWAALNSLRPLTSVETTVGSVEAKYHHGDEIGRGAMGVVRLSMDRASGAEVAIKTVTLPEQPEDLKDLELELAIARRLKHPNIVRLEEVIKNEEGYHLVMELCNGGNLYDFVTEREIAGIHNPISTQLHCAYTLQMLSGLAYIHHHRIMHRDIKPDNYVLANREPDSPLKLTDFGLACNFKKGEFLSQKCGTLYTMAPEILKRKYTEKCDVWSVGVTIFFLTSGKPPFWGLMWLLSRSALSRVRQYSEKPGTSLTRGPRRLCARCLLLMTLPARVPKCCWRSTGG